MGFVQKVIPERVGHESLSPGVTDGKSQEEKPKVGPTIPELERDSRAM